jgi:glycerone phosphate O-acyltransferase
MLATCVELFLKGHRSQDIFFVPIGLTYERLLEETLYANELLGIPKPKETVSGLVKARSILNECYGSIFINFGRPISLREVVGNLELARSIRNEASITHRPRNLTNLTPTFIFELTQSQLKSIECLSYYLLIEMLKNQVIQPITVIATCLLVSMVKYHIYRLYKLTLFMTTTHNFM